MLASGLTITYVRGGIAKRNAMYRPATVIPALLLGIALTSPATAQGPMQFKLTASDGAAGDLFGHAVSVSGDTALVGAYGNDDAGTDAGSAYVFVKNPMTGVWEQQQKLTANDAATSDNFGTSVAISGDTALVGARGNADAGRGSGSAYIFVRSGATWTEQQKLTASDAASDSFFGDSVAVSGDTALIGAPGTGVTGSSSGSVYVFARTGTTWTERQKLVANDSSAGDGFGRTLSMSGQTAIVGAQSDSAHVFVRNPTTGNWVHQQELTASDAGTARGGFGHSVAMSGETALVGSYVTSNLFSGSVYVFVKNPVTGIWEQQQKLIANDAAAQDYFGWSVAVSGDAAFIGAVFDDDAGTDSGSVYIFLRTSNAWNFQQKLTAEDASDHFGISVAISGNTALVGANFNDGAVPDSGASYVYTRPGSSEGFSAFGTGCPGTAGIPSLAAASGQPPWIDHTFTVEFSGMPTAVANVPFGVLGLSKTTSGQFALPLDLSPFGIWNCTQFVSLDFVATISNNGGTAIWDIPIPNNPFLIGLPIYVQGAVLDFGVNPANLIVTNAGEGVIGGW